jgi:nucleolar protein 12
MLKGSWNPKREGIYNPKISPKQGSLQGRAARLLGKAGAARLKRVGDMREVNGLPNKKPEGIAKTLESIIFEGYRANPISGRPKDLKFGTSGGGKEKSKARTRSSRRASEWRKRRGKSAK